MRFLILLLSLLLAACGTTGEARPRTVINAQNVIVERGAYVEVRQNGYGRDEPRRCRNEYGWVSCTTGDSHQYIPPYHPYNNFAPRFSFGPEGMSPGRTQYRNQPGTVRRQYGGQEGFDPARTQYSSQPGTVVRSYGGEEGWVASDTQYDNQPGTVDLNSDRRRRDDRRTRQEGFDPDDVDFDQPRVRPERRERSALDRCPYHPSSLLAQSDPRC